MCSSWVLECAVISFFYTRRAAAASFEKSALWCLGEPYRRKSSCGIGGYDFCLRWQGQWRKNIKEIRNSYICIHKTNITSSHPLIDCSFITLHQSDYVSCAIKICFRWQTSMTTQKDTLRMKRTLLIRSAILIKGRSRVLLSFVPRTMSKRPRWAISLRITSCPRAPFRGSP